MNRHEKIAKKNILRHSKKSVHGLQVRGYDFSEGDFSFKNLLASYKTTGFQATNLARACDIIKSMRAVKATIFLGYTSNLVTSGLRDVFRFLVQNKHVHVLVTTAGGIEEDIMKCIDPFYMGDFRAPGKELRKAGINRTGNIFVPNDNYCNFEKFFIPFLEKLYQEQKQGARITPSYMIRRIGEEINNERSIYYWAAKHNIPVFCPAITDGSMGDMIYFFKSKHKDFTIDVTDDICAINTCAMDAKKTGIIALGEGLIKHHICNANMFRNGADYAVYVNTAPEYDGSDTGALPEEAVSWGKVLPEASRVKVFADATLVFPLIVTQTFTRQSL